MKTEIPIEQLLRWRLAQAEADAPPAPTAARLLELSRPWWEKWPEQFQALAGRLGQIQIAYGHAMAEPGQFRAGHPVPALVIVGEEQLEALVRVLYFSVRDGRLRLRFQLEGMQQQERQPFDVTFVCNASQRPVVSSNASPSVDGEFRVETELSPDLGRDWERLKVTDRMPFRLILRADVTGG